MKSALNSYDSLISETFTADQIKKARGINSKSTKRKKSKKKSGRI